MKYQGCLLAVKDIAASKHFYEKVLHQNAVMDIGVHVTFEGFLCNKDMPNSLAYQSIA